MEVICTKRKCLHDSLMKTMQLKNITGLELQPHCHFASYFTLRAHKELLSYKSNRKQIVAATAAASTQGVMSVTKTTCYTNNHYFIICSTNYS